MIFSSYLKEIHYYSRIQIKISIRKFNESLLYIRNSRRIYLCLLARHLYIKFSRFIG